MRTRSRDYGPIPRGHPTSFNGGCSNPKKLGFYFVYQREWGYAIGMADLRKHAEPPKRTETTTCPLCKGKAEVRVAELANGTTVRSLRPHTKPKSVAKCLNRKLF